MTGPSPDLELFQFIHSHFNEKARWTLDYKRLAHRRTSLLPGPHIPVIRKLTGQTATPVLRIGSEYVHDSANIVARLDEVFPDIPLIPADPALRDKALGLQEMADTDIGPSVQHCAFAIVRRYPDYMADMVGGHLPWLKRKAYRAMIPAIINKIAVMMQLDDEALLDHRRKTLAASLDRVAAGAGPSGYLAGDAFSIADLAAAALISPIAVPAECQSRMASAVPEELAEWAGQFANHEAIAWTREMFRRHRGQSMETD